MDNKNKNDVAAKPSAGASESKDKHAQLELHPRKGRGRVPNTENELNNCGTENPAAPEEARIQQLGKNFHRNTN